MTTIIQTAEFYQVCYILAKKQIILL